MATPKLRLASALLGAVALLAAIPGAAEALELTVAIVNPPDDPTSDALNRMKEKLEAGASDLTLTIFNNGQMGTETDYVEQLRLGALSMTTVANSVVSTFSPTVGVLDIPYLLTTQNDQAWKVLDGPIGQRLAEKVKEDTGMVVVAWWNAGVRSVYARDRVVHTPEDMKGLRIRVIGSPVYLDTFAALGAQPVAMPLGEIYTSLATGAIDAGESDPSGYRVMHFYEQAPKYSLTSHILLIRPLLMNADVLAEMTPEERADFDAAVADATAYQRQLFADRFESDLEFLQSQGVEVTRPDLDAFRAAVAPVVQKYSEQLGADIVAEIQGVQ